MRNSDMGGSDAQFHCRTHLGHLLAAGDTVIGYGCCCNVKGFLQLETWNISNSEQEMIG